MMMVNKKPSEGGVGKLRRIDLDGVSDPCRHSAGRAREE